MDYIIALLCSICLVISMLSVIGVIYNAVEEKYQAADFYLKLFFVTGLIFFVGAWMS